jgi:hypothetical protein
MVVATEIGEGGIATLVAGMYNGHFQCVRGYMKLSVKLTLVQGQILTLQAAYEMLFEAL